MQLRSQLGEKRKEVVLRMQMEIRLSGIDLQSDYLFKIIDENQI